MTCAHCWLQIIHLEKMKRRYGGRDRAFGLVIRICRYYEMRYSLGEKMLDWCTPVRLISVLDDTDTFHLLVKEYWGWFHGHSLFPFCTARCLHDTLQSSKWWKMNSMSFKWCYQNFLLSVTISILMCWHYLGAGWQASWAGTWQADPLTQTRPWQDSQQLLVRFTTGRNWPGLFSLSRRSQLWSADTECLSYDKKISIC